MHNKNEKLHEKHIKNIRSLKSLENEIKQENAQNKVLTNCLKREIELLKK